MTTDSPIPFQARVQPWLLECFGQVIASDSKERNHRFLEESLELVQACGCTQSEAHQLVDYVYGRDVGEKRQEVGGVMVSWQLCAWRSTLICTTAGKWSLLASGPRSIKSAQSRPRSQRNRPCRSMRCTFERKT